MFLYEKKIVYLSLFQDGMKQASSGFIRLSREENTLELDIHIKNEKIYSDGGYTLYLAARSREIDWGTVTVEHGRADARRYFVLREGYARFGEEEFEERDLCGIVLYLDEHRWIAGYWQEPDSVPVHVNSPELSAADKEPDKKPDKTESKKMDREPDNASQYREIYPEPDSGDKWEQLQRCYKSVHPFGDERIFLSIEPKDFIILQASYQRLVNNSFLLHGFYNYRHLILGPDREIGNGDGSCFYLGVPGTYFEREKMVAIMFGFEGFECAGAVEIGKFGYYMRRVEL